MKIKSNLSALVAVLIGVLSVGANAAVRKGPYMIYEGANTEMRLLWQLDTSQSCRIEWGETVSYGNSDTTSEYGNDHQYTYTITGLTPGVKYYYRVVDVGSGSFTAAPPNNATDVKFLAYGDTRSYPADQDAVCAQMITTYTNDPAFQTITLHVGDWVSNGDSESDWSSEFFDPTYDNMNAFQANMPLNGCRGNHEKSGKLFYKYFPYPYPYVNNFYWSYDYGPLHIAVVDQYTWNANQRDWLENDLASSTKQWKLILLHEPGWSAGGGHSNNSTVQNDIQPLCLAYGVDFVVGGHNHYYARCDVDGVHHITTGGGGAPLRTPDMNYPNLVVAESVLHFCEFDIQGNQLSFVARRADGTVLDNVLIKHGPAYASGQNPPDETADKAFDGDINTKWLNFSTYESWIQYQYDDSVIVAKYAITSANDHQERDPMDWNLLGSNDGGANWDTLDSRTGELFPNRSETRNFFVSNSGAYNLYRMEITSVRDVATADSVQIAEIGLITVSPDGDEDGDGLANAAERIIGTEIYNPDTDGDGYTDGEEVDHDGDPTDGDDLPAPWLVNVTIEPKEPLVFGDMPFTFSVTSELRDGSISDLGHADIVWSVTSGVGAIDADTGEYVSSESGISEITVVVELDGEEISDTISFEVATRAIISIGNDRISDNDTVSIPVTLTSGGGAVAELSFTLSLDSTVVELVGIEIGGAADDAGKSVTVTELDSDNYIVEIGGNDTVMANGTVATINVKASTMSRNGQCSDLICQSPVCHAPDDSVITTVGVNGESCLDLSFKPGDVDRNGSINVSDIQIVINRALNIPVKYNCDINNSGTVNAIDVQLVINAVLGL